MRPVPAPGSGPLVSRVEADPRMREQLEDSTISNCELAQAFGVSESSVRRWRTNNKVGNERAYLERNREPEHAIAVGHVNGEQRARLHDRLDQVLDSLDVDAERVKGLRVNQWENVMRGPDGDPVITQLQGIKLDIKATEAAPEWPLIDRTTVVMKVIPPGEPRPPHQRDMVAVILPDPQIGYRQFDNGELDPFHDEDAIDVAMQITADISPSSVICLGDFEDFAEFGKYAQEAAFARTTQRGINRGHEFCAQIRRAAPDAKVRIMEGNHDRRAQKRISETNLAAWGIRRAADTTGWPVFSVPYLCAFDLFGIEYVGGYPAGEVWITDELRCIHGIKVRSNSSTAAAVVKDDGVSTIFGHVHRIETQYLSTRVRGGHKTRLAHTPGCLCRIDGSVPSAKGSTTLDGRPVPGAENWQQGLSVVEYRAGRPSFALHSIYIDTASGYEARFNGRLYTPRRRRK